MKIYNFKIQTKDPTMAEIVNSVTATPPVIAAYSNDKGNGLIINGARIAGTGIHLTPSQAKEELRYYLLSKWKNLTGLSKGNQPVFWITHCNG